VDVLVETADRRAAWSLDLGSGTQSDLMIQQARDAALSLMKSIEEGQFRDAQETLDGLRFSTKPPAELRYFERYNRAVLAQNEGDYRTALTAIREAIEIADRVFWDPDRPRAARHEEALILSDLGRFRDASRLFEELIGKKDIEACEKAQLLTNQGWSALQGIEAGGRFEDPAPLFRSSLKSYVACNTLTPDKEFNLWINLALAHFEAGRLAKAKASLDRARHLKQAAPLYQKLWAMDLEASVALKQGQPKEALRKFQQLEECALGTTSPDGRLRAVFGQARSYAALGNRAATLEALERAEALLDEQSLQIPIHEGRESFMATRQGVVSLHVETLLGQGSTAQALDMVRRARSRLLRQLERGERLAGLSGEQRSRWESLLTEYQKRRRTLEELAKDDLDLTMDQLSGKQAARQAVAEEAQGFLDQMFKLLEVPGEQPGKLSPPRPGELILAYYPLDRGWIGFAAEGGTVKPHRFELPESLPGDKELAKRLLWPFRDPIQRARRIRILASGPLQGVDFHALPFEGSVLQTKAPVVYGLDLPVSPGKALSRRALLIANPTGDLPNSVTEVQNAQNTLRGRGWSTMTLEGAKASKDALQERLAGVDLLHYAGHGDFSGREGWESNLRLAQETRLTLPDLLALNRAVPAWVILSSCETGKASTETPVESLGLAQAFLLAGSRSVIASTRPADDRTVAAFFSELYRQWDGGQDLAVALQRAQLDWRKRNPREDWAGFRIFEP
jgi:tetratricopeptide (TPR) repeat protein